MHDIRLGPSKSPIPRSHLGHSSKNLGLRRQLPAGFLERPGEDCETLVWSKISAILRRSFPEFKLTVQAGQCPCVSLIFFGEIPKIDRIFFPAQRFDRRR